jgi:hypothetical protein
LSQIQRLIVLQSHEAGRVSAVGHRCQD